MKRVGLKTYVTDTLSPSSSNGFSGRARDLPPKPCGIMRLRLFEGFAPFDVAILRQLQEKTENCRESYGKARLSNAQAEGAALSVFGGPFLRIEHMGASQGQEESDFRHALSLQ